MSRIAAQLRKSSELWMVVARRKPGFDLQDERAAAVRAAKYCRRSAWRMK